MPTEPQTETSVGLETPNQTVARARAMLEPTVSASEIASPPARIQTPVPQVATNDGRRLNSLIGNVTDNAQQFITVQSEEASKARELATALGEQSFDGSGQRADLNEQFNVPTNLARLQDIQTTLARRNEQTANQQAIAASGGAGAGQAQRAIGLADRQAAIRDAGLAAEASILQGNIETAGTLINQAMTDYYADRQATNANMIQQLDYVSSIVGEQRSELLEKERRVYEEDQRMVERTLNTVDAALQSGAASPNEIKLLTNPNSTDGERLALAQLIQARGASEIRGADMAIKAIELAKLREPTVATRDTSVIDVGGNKQLVDTQTGEVIATFGADVSSDEITKARDINYVTSIDTLKNHPGMSKAVGTTGLARFTPFKADVMTGQVSDFVGSVENVVKILTLNTLQEQKAAGATFGAMDKSEWDILGQSATKIAQWKREREDGSVYYDTSEANMNKELDTLSYFAKLASLRKGANPADIGVVQQPDGTYWTRNSNGTYTQLSITPQ